MSHSIPVIGISGPLEHTYYFMQDLSFQTSVTGPDRSTAAVRVQIGTYSDPKTPIWATRLDAAKPVHTTQEPIIASLPVYGNVTIDPGATFTLTPPDGETEGKVVFNGTITSNPTSQRFKLVLFSWPSSSGL